MGGDRRATRRGFLGLLGAAVGAVVLGQRSEAVGSSRPGAIDFARATATGVRLDPPTRVFADWREVVVGSSVEHRPIVAHVSEAMNERAHVLLVAGIHGDEPGSTTVANACVDLVRPDDVSLTIVPAANPDGLAAGTRNNVRDVDVNRNFPWKWGNDDHGPAPASEPETVAVMNLVADLRPDLAVFMHQPLGYIAPIGDCPLDYAQAWADTTGSWVRRRVLQPGGSESWASEVMGVHSLLVEIAGWELTADQLTQHHAAFQHLTHLVRART